MLQYEHDDGVVMAEHLLVVIFETLLLDRGWSQAEVAGTVKQLMPSAQAMHPISVKDGNFLFSWHLSICVVGKNQPLLTPRMMQTLCMSLQETKHFRAPGKERRAIAASADGSGGKDRKFKIRYVDMYLIAYFEWALSAGFINMAYGPDVTSLVLLEQKLQVTQRKFAKQFRAHDESGAYIGQCPAAVNAVKAWVDDPVEKEDQGRNVLSLLLREDQETVAKVESYRLLLEQDSGEQPDTEAIEALDFYSTLTDKISWAESESISPPPHQSVFSVL